jgi:hypothetical protein
LQLGGNGPTSSAPPAFEPCQIDGLPEIFREAQADEEVALPKMVAANPMGLGRVRTSEALANLTAAQEKHRKLQVRREELMRLMIAAGK